jgi:AraC-like DNA-binding protein
MVKWVRSGVMEGAAELVAELSGDFRALVRQAGLTERALNNPDLPIPVNGFVRFLELSAQSLGEEAFGLRMGSRQTLGLFGPMAPLLNSAMTIEVMLHDLADYFPLHTQGAIINLVRDPEGLVLTYELSASAGEFERQVVELGFGVLWHEIRRHHGGWIPMEVQFRHSAPRDRIWHRRLLGSNIVYNADRNSMLFETDLLRLPTLEGNRAQHDPLADSYRAASRKTGGIVAIQTEALVRMLLPFAAVELDGIATRLRHSRRTLQRRLAEDGTSLAEILDQVRAKLAWTYLCESSLGVAQVAELLQFSETSALTRAVRRWFGTTPRALRYRQPIQIIQPGSKIRL